MRADRLLSILLILRTRNRVPATDLAGRLEVSVRTIHRDVEALSAAGIPVTVLRGRHGGIGLLPGFRTDVTGLTEDEARALFVATTHGAHASLGLDRAFSSALRKVRAALPAPHRPAVERTGDRVMVDQDRWFTPKGHTADLTELLRAVLTDHRLRIRYRHGGAGPLHRYTVDPYGLVAKAGVWYLVADHRRHGRLFRADRLASFVVDDVPARHRPGTGLRAVWDELRQQVERPADPLMVTARVHRDRLPLLRRVLGSTVVHVPEPDGTEWPVLRFAFRELGAVHQLLQFGGDVEVVHPPQARELVAGAVAALHARYGDGDGTSRPAGPAARGST